jgi:hypothetical protein
MLFVFPLLDRSDRPSGDALRKLYGARELLLLNPKPNCGFADRDALCYVAETEKASVRLGVVLQVASYGVRPMPEQIRTTTLPNTMCDLRMC